MLTREHHRIVEQFKCYKNAMEDKLSRTFSYFERDFDFHYELAMLAPCYEASYALSDLSALKLYDCVLPQVKSMVPRCSQCTKMHQLAGIDEPPVTEEQLKKMTEYWNVNKLILDNKGLLARNDYLRKELDIVDWYVKYMEDGVDSKAIMLKHIELIDKNQELDKKNRKQ